MNLLELYCHVDEFVKSFLPEWNTHLLEEGKKKRIRTSRLSPSEIITILIHFHQSQYRNFKSFYLLQIEHTRHRSVVNGFINVIAGLVAYTHHDKKKIKYRCF